MNYIYTVAGSRCEEDAIDFMIGILETEYSSKVSQHACEKAFKRVMAQTDQDINKRLERMSSHSSGEYSYRGTGKDGLAIYTFWGLI